MATAVVIFTRDLRVRDHPALSAACSSSDRVLPGFVLDEEILGSSFNRPNRTGFLLEALTDLDGSLRKRGGRLVLRRGQWVDQVLKLARDANATEIHVSDDVSGLAQRRLATLENVASERRVSVRRHDGITIVSPGAITPPNGDHYKVFTPYYRRWLDLPWRPSTRAPTTIHTDQGIQSELIPSLDEVVRGVRSPDVMPGGETEARRRLKTWSRSGLNNYAQRRDDLSDDVTSRLSAYLHFGCVSPLEVATNLRGDPRGEAFVRQLCWRDFYHQVLAARPDAAWHDYRSRGDRWNDDRDGFDAWRLGRTGFPVIDAGMRQLAREGFMHNRVRMIVASFLTKDLYIDWRWGASHFLDWLVDGDVANNNLNWQWTAGTGTDANPYRVFNPTVQGTRFDPRGDYIHRYVAELADVPGPEVHNPGPSIRSRVSYPAPIVDHRDAIARYQER